MKSRHRIALAVMISLGLLTWAPVANAKSVDPAQEVDHDDPSRVINMIKHHQIHLPAKLNRIYNKLLKSQEDLAKLDRQDQSRVHADLEPINANRQQSPDDHLARYLIIRRFKKANGTTRNNQDSRKPAMENSRGRESKKIDSRSKVKHNAKTARKAEDKHKAQSASHKNLIYNRTKLPAKPKAENSHRIIGGMKRFIQKRDPYRYTAVGNNTRDLGGYPTADRKHQTRVDRIIRSADLNGLSKTGTNALQQLHVHKIVDLRYQNSKNGIQGHPDPNELKDKTLKGTRIVYQQDPVYSYDEAKKFDHYMRNHDIRGEYYFYGAPSVTEPQAIKAYRKIFNDLLSNHRGAILFHCNLGRDRTGVTSALILSSLGVDQNVIYHDYLLTDHYHYNFRRQPYSKPAGELKYFFSTIDQKYGNVNNYLHRAIGLSNGDLHQLRSMYLVSGNTRQTINKPRQMKKHAQNSKSEPSSVKSSLHKKGHQVKGHKKIARQVKSK